jgi:predicted PurR-regulated permease PerM
MVAAAQRAQGASATVSDTAAVGIAVAALTGAVAWFALSVLTIPSGLLVGVAWPLVAMALVTYLQTGFNDAVGGDRSSTTPVSTS